jgi:hypothetical protein
MPVTCAEFQFAVVRRDVGKVQFDIAGGAAADEEFWSEQGNGIAAATGNQLSEHDRMMITL